MGLKEAVVDRRDDCEESDWCLGCFVFFLRRSSVARRLERCGESLPEMLWIERVEELYRGSCD